MEKQNESSYEVYVFCDNCHCHENISILKGKIISDIDCPNCGNKTLEIDPNGEIINRKKIFMYLR